MFRIKFALAVVGFYSAFSVHQSVAGPLTSAEVTKIINRVSVIDLIFNEGPGATKFMKSF